MLTDRTIFERAKIINLKRDSATTSSLPLVGKVGVVRGGNGLLKARPPVTAVPDGWSFSPSPATPIWCRFFFRFPKPDWAVIPIGAAACVRPAPRGVCRQNDGRIAGSPPRAARRAVMRRGSRRRLLELVAGRRKIRHAAFSRDHTGAIGVAPGSPSSRRRRMRQVRRRQATSTHGRFLAVRSPGAAPTREVSVHSITCRADD
jgi:hypothetical protein